MNKLLTRASTCLLRIDNQMFKSSERFLNLSKQLNTFQASDGPKGKSQFPTPKRWPKYNDVIKPPVPIDSPAKPRADYYHFRENIKYSPKKMWYICSFVRGMTVDEAVKQLSFVTSKGAHIAKEVILEAQEKAILNGFEFKSNMYISRCFCTKSLVIKGQRKHARGRFGEIRYFFLHFYVTVTEGPPPKDYYYDPNPKTGKEKLEKFIEDHRDKKIEWTS